MKYKWGQLISLEYGKPVTDKAKVNGKYPVYGTNGQIGTSDLPPLCNHASFILGRKGAYRGVHYSSIPFSVIDTAFYAENLHPELLNIEWAYYKFLTYDINSMDSGSAIPSTDRYEIYAIEVDLPDYGLQEKVVGLLRSFDDKIKLNNKINDNLQQQAATVFKAWFIDYITFGGNVPKNWHDVVLEDITAMVCRGITPKYSDKSCQKVINQKCIRNHTIDLSLARCHTPKVINEKWLHFGDLLINSTGDGTLGRAAQVWFQPNDLTVDSHVTIVRPMKEELIYYIGLWGLLHEREIESLHTGSTGQTELPRDRLKALKLLLPDGDTLNSFNAVISPMVSAIVSYQEENQRLAAIRDALLPKLISGELNISEITI